MIEDTGVYRNLRRGLNNIHLQLSLLHGRGGGLDHIAPAVYNSDWWEIKTNLQLDGPISRTFNNLENRIFVKENFSLISPRSPGDIIDLLFNLNQTTKSKLVTRGAGKGGGYIQVHAKYIRLGIFKIILIHTFFLIWK